MRVSNVDSDVAEELEEISVWLVVWANVPLKRAATEMRMVEGRILTNVHGRPRSF
jgi:hypothetical protein